MTSMLEQRLQEALDQLPWLERSCLLFSINTDLTPQEIADILDMTEEQVSTAILQGHQQFRCAYYREREAQSHTTATEEKDFPLNSSMNTSWYEKLHTSTAIPTGHPAPDLHYVLPYIPVTASEVTLIDKPATDNAIANAHRLLPSVKVVEQVSNKVDHQTTGPTVHLSQKRHNARTLKWSKIHQSSRHTASISSVLVIAALVATVLLFGYSFLPDPSNSHLGSHLSHSNMALMDVNLVVNNPTDQSAPPPQLCNVRGVDLGQVPSGQSTSGTISFSNCGGQPLTWQAQSDSSFWLKLNKSNGTIASNGTDQIPFTATASTSAQGLISATVMIVPTFGQPQQAVVTMTVVAPPPQLCNVRGVDLGRVPSGQSTSGTISFSNCGGQPLTWQAQSDGSFWLKLNKSNGTIASNGTDQIPFTATASTSVQGLVSATVTITPTVGQPLQAIVTITVVPLPCITVYPTTLSFTAQQGGENPASQSFTVTNCGDAGTVTTSISANNGSPWLSADSGGKLDASSTLVINVSVNTQGLSTGSYTGVVIVTLTDTNSVPAAQRTTGSLTVTLPPYVNVNTAALSFAIDGEGSDPTKQKGTRIDSSGTKNRGLLINPSSRLFKNGG